MKHLILVVVFSLIVFSVLGQTNPPMKIPAIPEGAIVRLSIGFFQNEHTEKVEAMLNKEFKTSLIPAIQKLNGNLGYYVGIDREKHMITNVSFWKTKEDAMQMASLREMLAMRTTFESLGITFMEISNHEILWKL